MLGEISTPNRNGGLASIVFLNNVALILKCFDNFYSKVTVPWVELVWHPYCQILVPPLEIFVDLSGGGMFINF